jgi:membrane dipeptidase
MLVSTGRDIEKAKREGKFGVIMGSQNADILGGSLSLLPVYKRLGVRIIQLNYYEQNLLGEGFNERTDSGLSNFGLEVVKEMNRLGLVIDVSHCGDQVTMDAINYSKDPVMITHANARALCPHKRNKTDQQIKALAEKDGVIGLNAYSILCEVRKDIRPTLEDLLDMADYIVRLVGPDYVSLGLDLSFRTKESYMQWEQLYPNLVPKWGMFGRNIFQTDDGTVDVTLFPEITKGLVARGYSDDDIEKILGLNFLRVFKEVCG